MQKSKPGRRHAQREVGLGTASVVRMVGRAIRTAAVMHGTDIEGTRGPTTDTRSTS